MIDISKLICFQPGSGINPTHIVPFVLIRLGDHGTTARWLEYSPNDNPTEEDVATNKQRSKLQTFDRFTELPRITDASGRPTLIYDSVADRDATEIAVAKLLGLTGCLWTTLPKIYV